MIIDAFGKPCPMPLMLAKKELDAGCRDLSIRVDDETAVKNLTRLGARAGLDVEVKDIEGGYQVRFSAAVERALDDTVVPRTTAPSSGGGYAVFIGKDHVGEGDAELGLSLMKMALYTLAQTEEPPAALLFMNGGVKLVAGGDRQVVESVRALQGAGCEVLVCGTCLDFYGLKERLEAGEASNMYDILERMRAASKVITL